MKYIRPAVESEKTVLGAILLDNGVIRDIADKLCPKDFDIYFHEEIFEAMIRLHKKNGCVDVPMLTDDLNLNTEHEGYIYELANDCPSTRNVKAHADIIREKSIQRKLVEVSNEIKHQHKAQRNEKLSHLDHIASFLEECGSELRIANVDAMYLVSLLVEITKGFSATIGEEMQNNRKFDRMLNAF